MCTGRTRAPVLPHFIVTSTVSIDIECARKRCVCRPAFIEFTFESSEPLIKLARDSPLPYLPVVIRWVKRSPHSHRRRDCARQSITKGIKW
jgi:hypothetical protein